MLPFVFTLGENFFDPTKMLTHKSIYYSSSPIIQTKSHHRNAPRIHISPLLHYSSTYHSVRFVEDFTKVLIKSRANAQISTKLPPRTKNCHPTRFYVLLAIHASYVITCYNNCSIICSPSSVCKSMYVLTTHDARVFTSTTIDPQLF